MTLPFQPFRLRNLELRNRFVRSATYDGMADSNGHVTTEQIQLYQRLASGGVALIVTGITSVHSTGQISPKQNRIDKDDHIEGLSRLVEATHAHGALLAVQLHHAGREAAPFQKWQNRQAVSPSGVCDEPQFAHAHRALSDDEIQEIVRAHGAAAQRAQAAGLDAVQIHGAHGYLVSQFLSPHTNRRTDQWGGTLENRLRFHKEVLKTIREQVGPDYPVLIKLGVEDLDIDEGLQIDEGAQAAAVLAEEGYDALEISAGLRGEGYENTEYMPRINTEEREAYFREYTRRIKSSVDVPVMLVGGLRSPAVIERVIEGGDADLASLCRPLIREPGLIDEWRQGRRRRAACVSCNLCLEALLQGQTLSCRARKKSVSDK
jgi:2,4-dienoyl-CoA reductase-like NADH-dependent reductase (Old Yellow Enzyme family)